MLLDAPELVSRALSARAIVAELASERESAASETRKLEKDVEYRRKIVETDDRLVAAGALTSSTREADEILMREASEKLSAARENLRSIDGNGSEKEASRVFLARRAALDLEARLVALTVRARAAGRVYGLPRREGEAVTEGQPVAIVIDPRRATVRARVDPGDLPRVAAGQTLAVAFDGLPDLRWMGTVESVDPMIRAVAGREVAEAVGEVPDPESRLPANASVNVQIVVGEKASALVVPRAALYRDGSRRFVYVPMAGRAERREVTVGLLGISEAEIVSGLQEGERILLPGPVPLSAGVRVDAHP